MAKKRLYTKDEIVDAFGSECWEDIEYTFGGLGDAKDIEEAMVDYYVDGNKKTIAHSIQHWFDTEKWGE
jgi:hypothetical protein